MSANKWVAIINKSIKMKEDIVPKGFYPRKEIQKIWNVSKGEANMRLKDLFNQGLAEKKIFRVKDGRGVFPIRHYKLK